ncbi:MAG: tripartite tricarboxylate transporter substrate binding protein [Rhizobiales bacterium]|nr:tripartite tricarboxylate transporter substrate binding protein [Hyphomicrobiales bacterium]
MTKWLKSAALLALASGLAMAMVKTADAQSYPSRPVTVIVPLPAGGIVDVLVRRIGKELEARYKYNIVVENKPGANTQVAANACKSAAPDGYTTCLLTMSTMTLNPVLSKSVTYDPIKNFTPLTNIAFVEHMLIMNKSVPVKNFKELVEYSKANPDKLNYGTFGIGGDAHLSFEWIKKSTGAKLTHIPYRGAAPAMLAFTRGEAHLLVLTPGNGTLLEQIKEGKVAALAVEGDRRIDVLPNTPSYKEVGLPPFPARSWFGLFGPAGTPKVVVDKLGADLASVIKDQKMQKEFLIPAGLDPVGNSPAEFAKFLLESIAAGKRFVEVSGVKVD